MRIACASKVFSLVVVMLSTLTTHGAIIVSVSSYSVSAGIPVSAQFTVSNSSPVAASGIEGMTFTLQVADGLGATPKISSLDLLTGTIWAGHVSPANLTIPIGGNQSQYQSRDIFTDNAGDLVDANGLLATATFDTTGANPGDYLIKLVGTKTVGRDSVLLNGVGEVVPVTFGQGTITITQVPEPDTFILGLLGMCCLSRRKLIAMNRIGF